MPHQIDSDLRLEFEGHDLSLRSEGQSLVAEISSLSALRCLRRMTALRPGPLPRALHLPGLDELTARVVVRGRTIAVLENHDHVASVRPDWLALISTLLHLPARRG